MKLNTIKGSIHFEKFSETNLNTFHPINQITENVIILDRDILIPANSAKRFNVLSSLTNNKLFNIYLIRISKN